MKIPITIIDENNKNVRMMAIITPGQPTVHEPFDVALYDPNKDDHKAIIKAGWIEENPDD